MKPRTMQEEMALEHLIDAFKQGFRPFPNDFQGVSDCRKIVFHGGVAICENLADKGKRARRGGLAIVEDIVDRDDGDMNEYYRRSVAYVNADSIYEQALCAVREGRSVRTYESINTIYTKDRRSESPGSPDERIEREVLGEVRIEMDATMQPPSLVIDVRSQVTPKRLAITHNGKGDYRSYRA